MSTLLRRGSVRTLRTGRTPCQRGSCQATRKDRRMSHYNALVLIGKDITDIKAEVTRIIQPYFSDREPTDVPRVWDWWRIGGWWDGLLMLDRKTWEESQCAICAGNGRDAIHHHYTVAHEQLDRNVCEVAQLPEDTHVYSLWCEDAFLSTGYHLGSCAECFAYFNDDDVGYERSE